MMYECQEKSENGKKKLYNHVRKLQQRLNLTHNGSLVFKKQNCFSLIF